MENGNWQMGSTHFAYWLKVKQQTQTMAGMSGYLPYTTYIWAGATAQQNLDDDPAIEQLADDPRTDAENDPINEAAVPQWCFVYGEKEWMSGQKFSKVKMDARGDVLAEPAISPIGRVNCLTGADL